MSFLKKFMPAGLAAAVLLGLAAGPATAQWRFSDGLYSRTASEPALIQKLQSDPDPGQRQLAARHLGHIGSQRAMDALATVAAYDDDRNARIIAGDVIAQIRQRAVQAAPPAPAAGYTAGYAPDPAAGDRTTRLVEQWYLTFLRRPADPGGLAERVNALRQGRPVEETVAGILGSDEYFRVCGGSVPAWITGLYRDVLRRDPRPDEVQSWINGLAQLGGNRAEASKAFVTSARQNVGQQLDWLYGY
jgi:hypothetical protein